MKKVAINKIINIILVESNSNLISIFPKKEIIVNFELSNFTQNSKYLNLISMIDKQNKIFTMKNCSITNSLIKSEVI